jgi:Predicted membrane protein (DUF2142)
MLGFKADKKRLFLSQWKMDTFIVYSTLVICSFLWIFVQPPFSSVDEVHHVSKAWFTANVQAIAESNVRKSNTELTKISVPEWTQPDSFAPGPPGCYLAQGPSVTPDSCGSYPWDRKSITVIENQMAQYFPTYYWIVGQPSKIAEGEVAYYLMRFTSFFLCFTLLYLAFSINYRNKIVSPFLLSFLFTPMVVQGAATLAPLATETAAAILSVLSLLAISARSEAFDIKSVNLEKSAFLVASFFLLTTRPSGILWGTFLVAFFFVFFRFQALLFIRKSPVISFMFCVFYFLSAVFNYFHRLETRPYPPAQPVSFFRVSIDSFSASFDYLRNFVGIFGQAGIYLPEFMYAFYLCGLVILAYIALENRGKLFFAAIILSSLFLIFVPNYTTRNFSYLTYQGRYGIPLMAVIFIFGTANHSKRYFLHYYTLVLMCNATAVVLSALRFSYGLLDVSPNAFYRIATTTIKYELPFFRLDLIWKLLALVMLMNLGFFLLRFHRSIGHTSEK